MRSLQNFQERLFGRTPPDDCFLGLPLNFEKLFGTPYLKNTSERLLKYLHVQVAGFQAACTVTISQVPFKHFV